MVKAGAVAATTTSVASELVVDVCLTRFVALTTNRTVLPASAATSLYDAAAAPAMFAQATPSLSQRCHWYVNVASGVSHPGSPTPSVCPTYASPWGARS